MRDKEDAMSMELELDHCARKEAEIRAMAYDLLYALRTAYRMIIDVSNQVEWSESELEEITNIIDRIPEDA